MKILMIVPHYAPDLGPSAPLFTMLSTELRKRGHQIIILTTVPHYPTGQVPAAFRGRLIQRSVEKGVEIIRIRIPSVQRADHLRRMIQYIVYQLGAAWAGWSKAYDCVFVANPALWVWLPFASLVVLRRKPAIFSIYDVYPDVGVRLGIFHNKRIIALVAALERYCLKHSVKVRIISESFRPGIHRLGVPDSKIEMMYDWVDTGLIQPLPHDNDFTRRNGLNGHFIVQYAGNLGLSQGLEHVLTAAEQLKAHPDILFMFVGDGADREHLVAETEKRRLTNVRFLPFQPRECVPEVLASADVALVSLKQGIGFDSLPSKTFSILASGRPIIASVDHGCETWNIIQKSGAGICIPPENPATLASTVLRLKQDQSLRELMGNNGRKWALEHHSPPVAAEQFEHLFESIQSTFRQ